MKPEEAAVLVDTLFAVYPDSRANEATYVSWIDHLRTLDAVTATMAMGRLKLEASRFPTLAEFREWYRLIARERQIAQPVLEAVDPSWPQTPEQWERLAMEHRKLRARDYPDTDDPSQRSPLPRNKLDFDKEWVEFIHLRFGIKVGT